jgi:hypothetical protein
MAMTAVQRRWARRSSAARLLGVGDLPAPFGKINICPTGSKIEAASEATTSKSKSSVMGTLIRNTATTNGHALSMVNECSYWSISGEGPTAESSKEKGRPRCGPSLDSFT